MLESWLLIREMFNHAEKISSYNSYDTDYH